MTASPPYRCREAVGGTTRHRRARICCAALLSTFIAALMSAEADALCGAGYGERS